VLVATVVEDEAVFRLAVPVDAAHALLQPVQVPRDVAIEQDVAALEVDALASRLRGHEHLGRALLELLLGMQPGSGVVTRADVHAAVDVSFVEFPARVSTGCARVHCFCRVGFDVGVRPV
jgi:hypothetical protein